MSNFNLTMPGYLAGTFTQLVRDKNFSRDDLASLKQAAAAQQGSTVQEALENATLKNLEQRLAADSDGNLRLDAVQVETQSLNVGQAIFQVSLLPDAPAAPTTQVAALAQTPPVQPPPAQTPARTPGEPSAEEQAWASELEKKARNNYQPTPAEQAKYQDIGERYLASRKGKPAPTAEELAWANEIQRKADAGQDPSPADLPRFRDIVARQALQVRAQIASAQKPPTAEDMRWAADLETKAKTGYMPTEAEQARYREIALAYAKFGPPQPAQPEKR